MEADEQGEPRQTDGAATTRTPPGPYLRAMARLERWHALDPAVRAVEPLAARLVADPRRRRVLHGDATGIPPHTILTDVPFGAWFMAQYLDLFDDEAARRAATRLVGLGVVGAVPTALAGWAEWALSDRGTRRVGVVHAASNLVGTLVFAASWVARLRGQHRRGAALARLGGAVVIVGGFTGGYMRSERVPAED